MSSQEGDNMATDNAVEDNSGSSTAAVANNSTSNDNTIATTNNNSNNEQPPSTNNNNNNTATEEEEKRKKKEDEASQKRRAIQSIMKDTTLTDLERRFRIQNLMDGSSSSKKQNGGKVGREGIGMGREELLRGGICRSTAVTASLRNLGTSLLGNSAASGGTGDVNSSSLAASANTNQEQQNTGVTPCIHYERKCNIISPCCQRIFGCRICHDDVMNLLGGSGAISSPLPSGGIGISDGECGPMDRFGIKEIVCKECNVLQDSK